MPKNKSKSEVPARSIVPAAAPVLSDDIAALLNSKIKEFETNKAEASEKSLKKAGKSLQAQAKAKLKEAKQLVGAEDIDGPVKVQRLLERLDAEHELTEQAVKEQLKMRQDICATEKDRDAAQVELQRASGIKGKLESLCRQLQQQTNALIDERRRLSEKERQRRQELADEFQNTISDVKKTMDQQAQERTRLARENEELRSRFKTFFEQYDTREKERLEQQQARDLEVQVFELRLAEQAQLYRAEATKEAYATRENEVQKLTGQNGGG